MDGWKVVMSIWDDWDKTFFLSSSPPEPDSDNVSLASSMVSSMRGGIKDRHLRAERALGVTMKRRNEIVLVGVFRLPTITLSLTPAEGRTISMSLKGLSSRLRIGGAGMTIEGAMGGVKISWTEEKVKYALVRNGGMTHDKLANIKIVRDDERDETRIIARFETLEVNYNAERIKKVFECLEKLKTKDEGQEIITRTKSPSMTRKGSILGAGVMLGTGFVGAAVASPEKEKTSKTVVKIQAELRSVALYLNSVLDDEILFGMKMSSLGVDMTMEGDDELAVNAKLRDFEIFTDAENHRVHEGWRNIFGMR